MQKFRVGPGESFPAVHESQHLETPTDERGLVPVDFWHDLVRSAPYVDYTRTKHHIYHYNGGYVGDLERDFRNEHSNIRPLPVNVHDRYHALYLPPDKPLHEVMAAFICIDGMGLRFRAAKQHAWERYRVRI